MRLLVITHTFPPSRHSNAKRPYYLVKGFLDAGWEVDVFTSANLMDIGAPEILEHPRLRIVRRLTVHDLLLRKLGTTTFLYRAISLVDAALLWPDVFVWWSIRILRLSQRSGPYDRTLVFVVPVSLLLAGLSAGRVGRDWTVDYQESITPQQRVMLRRSPLHRWLLPRLARLERRTLHAAGRAVFTAETNRQAYIQAGLVPSAASVHVPYFFDSDAFRAAAPSLLEGFQIGYFGTFDWHGARSPETFLRSLSRFLERQPGAGSQTRFVFHGNWLAAHDRLVAELKLSDVVSVEPPLGYAAYLQKLRQMPVLLLVIASEHNLFMPSKIVDYFGAARPVLGFVPRHSEMRTVLERAGMSDFACDEFDVAGGTAALEALWKRYQAGALTVDGRHTHFWASEVQVPRYVEMLTQPA